MQSERFWILLARKLAKEATEEELFELEYLLADDPEMSNLVETISVLWSIRVAGKRNREDVNKLLQRIDERKADGGYLALYNSNNRQKNKINHPFKLHFMFRSYFKIAIRNLQKQKAFAFINVFGLSVGIACFCLLLLFAANEFSFDKFNKNAANIYRPYIWYNSVGGDPAAAYTDYTGPASIFMGEAMKRDIPDIVDYVRLQLPWGENLVRTNKGVHRASVGFADQSIFSVFTFPLKYGNPASALHDKNDVVVTESRARELFGTDDVVGKVVEIQVGTTFQPFKITAVAKDMPANSTVRFDVLGNFNCLPLYGDPFVIGGNWHPTVRQTYVQLRPGSKLADQPKQLARFLQTFDPNYIANYKSLGFAWNDNQPPISFRLQPLLSIHTDSWFNGFAFTDYNLIDPKTIWILLAIAGGILLIACINFTTLAIGRSAGRSKEVGVRKVIGAEKYQIVFQFLMEAMLLAVASAVLGLVFLNLLLPKFNELSGRDLHLSLSLYPQIVLILLGLVLIVGLLAGSYPALVLSGFKPVEVLKNKIKVGGASLFTKSLITFQFALSIILIISTVIILQQAKYLVNKNPGFDKENVVAIDATQIDPNKAFPLFKEAIVTHAEITGVTSAAAGLGAGNELLGYSDNGLSAAINIVDTDYIKVLGMHLITGRNLTPALITDSIKPIVINETMMRAFGWNAGTAVGQRIKKFQGTTAIVTGVVKNFNYRPLREGVKNQVFETSTDKGYSHFYVRVNAGNPAQALNDIRSAWNSAVPGIPIKYSFLDEDVNRYYQAEGSWSGIVG